MSEPWKRENISRGMQEVERAKAIKACQHPVTTASARGYAFCDSCGAMLPDEDPNLREKCGL